MTDNTKPKLPKLVSWAAVAAACWGLGFIYNVHAGGETRWLKELYQKKIERAAAIDSPKLIITGGSGAHYTVNSEVIAQAIGRPVINLGIDGPVGLDVILPSVLPQVKPGDTVLLVPEYLILNDPDGLGDRSGPFGIAIGRPGLGNIPLRQLAQDWLMTGTPTLRGVVKSSTDLVKLGKFTGYYDDPLTEQGDPTVDKYRVGKWWELPIEEPATPHVLKQIEQFKREVEAQGGTLVLSLPWVYAEKTDETVGNIQKTAEQLKAIAPLIYDPENLNNQSDVKLFGDTHYHLTAEGRVLRSQQIARELKPLLNEAHPSMTP
jgi:hypothetical protein